MVGRERWRVLIVSQYFHPEQFHINGIARHLAGRGHEITVLTGLPNYPTGRFFEGYRLLGPYFEQWGDVSIRRVPLVPRGRAGSLRLALNYVSYALASSARLLIGLPERFDVVLVYEPSPITVAVPALVQRMLRRTPVVFWMLDLWPESLLATRKVTNRRLLRFAERLVGWLLRPFEAVLVQSPSFYQPLIERGIRPERIHDFPSPADIELSSDETVNHAMLPELPDGFKVVFAGNVGYAQDLPTILEAAERCGAVDADVAWIIIGDGRELADVRAVVNDRSLANVHLLGRQPRSSMPSYLRAADALLVCLRADPDLNRTVPGKIQSYMAVGRPIVGAIGGAGSDLLTASGSGRMVPPGDVAGLVDAVLRIKNLSPSERHDMGSRGREYYEEYFTVESAVDRLENHLSRAVTGGSGS